MSWAVSLRLLPEQIFLSVNEGWDLTIGWFS